MVEIMLTLTVAEVMKLREALDAYEDEGPFGEGYQSAVLRMLVAKVREATQEVRDGL
jgi:hypothetical protein